MSEQAEQTSAGAAVVEPVAIPTSPAEPKMTTMQGPEPAAQALDAPTIAPDHQEPPASPLKAELQSANPAETKAVQTAIAEPPQADTPKIADTPAPKIDSLKIDSLKIERPEPVSLAADPNGEALKAGTSTAAAPKSEAAGMATAQAAALAGAAPKPTLSILDLTNPRPPKTESLKADFAKPDAIKDEAARNERPKADTLKLSALGAAAPKIGPASALPLKPELTSKRLIMSNAQDRPGGDTLESVIQRATAAAHGLQKPQPLKAGASAKPLEKPPEQSLQKSPEKSAEKPAEKAEIAAAPHAVKPEAPTPPAFVIAGRRGAPALAAMLLLAVLVGGVGGAFTTMAFTHRAAPQPVAAAVENDAAASASVAKVESDVAALKAGLEQTNQTSLVELNKTAERLDKLEKVQGELAAKTIKPSEVQRLSEAVERLRAAQASAAVPSAAKDKDATGSVAPARLAAAAPQAAPAPQAPPASAPAVGRLPVVDGWVLRNVGGGGALIEGRQGLYEVYAGDPVPGLGRVDAIRKQDGRWVVVTNRGLIVSR